MTDSAEDLLEIRGRIARDGGAMKRARSSVQGVAITRRDEVGENASGFGVRDGPLAIEVVADEGRDDDGEGTPAVEPLESCPEESRQLLQASVIRLGLKRCVRLAIVCP